MTDVGNLRFFKCLRINSKYFYLLFSVFVVSCLNRGVVYATPLEDMYGYKDKYVNCNSINNFDSSSVSKTNYYSKKAKKNSASLFYPVATGCNTNGGNNNTNCGYKGTTGYFVYSYTENGANKYDVLLKNNAKPIALNEEEEGESYNCYYKKYECDSDITDVNDGNDFNLNSNIGGNLEYQLFRQKDGCSGNGCYSLNGKQYIRVITASSCTGYLPSCDNISNENANESLYVELENANLYNLGTTKSVKCLSSKNSNKSYCSDLINGGNLKYDSGVGDFNNPKCFLKSCADLTSSELEKIKGKTGKFCSEYRYIKDDRGFKYLPYGKNITPVYCSDLNEKGALKFPNGINKNKDNCLLKRCVALTADERNVVAKKNMDNVKNCILNKSADDIKNGACSKDKLPKYCDNEVFFINGPITNFDDIKLNTFPCSETYNVSSKMLSFRDLFFNNDYTVANTKNYICRSNIVPVKNGNLNSINSSFLCSVLVTKNEGTDNDPSYNTGGSNGKGKISSIEGKGYGDRCNYFGKISANDVSADIGGADRFVNVVDQVDNILAYLNADISLEAFKNIDTQNDENICKKITCSDDSGNTSSSSDTPKSCNKDSDCGSDEKCKMKYCISKEYGDSSSDSSTDNAKLSVPMGIVRYYIDPNDYVNSNSYFEGNESSSYFDCNLYISDYKDSSKNIYNYTSLLGYDPFNGDDNNKKVQPYVDTDTYDESEVEGVNFVDIINDYCVESFAESLDDTREGITVDISKVSEEAKKYYYSPIEKYDNYKSTGKNPPLNEKSLGCYSVGTNAWVEKYCKIPDLDSYYIASYETITSGISTPANVEFMVNVCLRHSDDVTDDNNDKCGLREGSQYTDKCIMVPANVLFKKDDYLLDTKYRKSYDKLTTSTYTAFDKTKGKDYTYDEEVKATTRVAIYDRGSDAKSKYVENGVVKKNHNFFRTDRYGRNVYTFYDFLTNINCNTSGKTKYIDGLASGVITGEAVGFCLHVPFFFTCLGASIGVRIPLEATFYFQSDTYYMKDYHEKGDGKGFYSNFNISDNNNYLYNYYRRGRNIEDDIKYKLEGSNGTYNDSTVLAKEIMKKCGLIDDNGSKLIKKSGTGGGDNAGEKITYTPFNLSSNKDDDSCYEDPEKCLTEDQKQCLKEYGVYFFKNAQRLDEINEMSFLDKYKERMYVDIRYGTWKKGNYGIIATGLVKYAENKIPQSDSNCKLDIYGNPVGDLEKCRGFTYKNSNNEDVFVKENQSVKIGLQTAPPVFFKLLSNKNMSELFNPTLRLSKYYASGSTTAVVYNGQSFKLDLTNPKMVFEYDFDQSNINLKNNIGNVCSSNCGISESSSLDANYSSAFVEIKEEDRDSDIYKLTFKNNKSSGTQSIYFFLRKTYKTDIKNSEIPMVCLHILAERGSSCQGSVSSDCITKGNRSFAISEKDYLCFERRGVSLNDLIFKPDDSFNYLKPYVNVALKSDKYSSKITGNFRDSSLAYLNRETVDDLNISDSDKHGINLTGLNTKQLLFLEFNRSDCSELEIEYFQKQRDLYEQKSFSAATQNATIISSLDTEINERIGSVVRNSCEVDDGESYYLYEGVDGVYNTYNRYKTKKDHAKHGGFSEICMSEKQIFAIREDNSSTFDEVVVFKDNNSRGEYSKCLLDKNSLSNSECLFGNVVYYECETNSKLCTEVKDSLNSYGDVIKTLVSSKTGMKVKAVGVNCVQLFEDIANKNDLTTDDIVRVKICYRGGYNPYGNIYKNSYDSSGNVIKDISCVCQKSKDYSIGNLKDYLTTRVPTNREAGFCFDLPKTPKCEAVKYYNAYRKSYDYDLPVFDTEYNEEKLCYRSVGGSKYNDDKCYSKEANANQHLWRSHEKMLGFVKPSSVSLGNAEFEDSVYCQDDTSLCLGGKSTDENLNINVNGQCRGFWKNSSGGDPVAKCEKIMSDVECDGVDATGNCKAGCISDNNKCVKDCKRDYEGNCIYEYKLVKNECQRYQCPSVFIYDDDISSTEYLNEVDVINNQDIKGFKGFLTSENTSYNKIGLDNYNSYTHVEESTDETVDKRGSHHGFATWKSTPSLDVMNLITSSNWLTGYAPAGSNYSRESVSDINAAIYYNSKYNTSFTGSDIDYDLLFNNDTNAPYGAFVSLLQTQVESLSFNKNSSEFYLENFKNRMPQRYCDQRGNWLDVRDIYKNVNLTSKTQFFYSGNDFWMNIFEDDTGPGVVDLSTFKETTDSVYNVYTTNEGKEEYAQSYISNNDKKRYNERLFCPFIEIEKYISSDNKKHYEYDIYKYETREGNFSHLTSSFKDYAKDDFNKMNKEFTWKHTGGARWKSVSAPRNDSSNIVNSTNSNVDDNLRITKILSNNNAQSVTPITQKYLKVVQGDCQEDVGYYDKDVTLLSDFSRDIMGLGFNYYTSQNYKSRKNDTIKTIDPREKTLIEKEGTLKPIRTCNSVGLWSGIGNKCLRACEMMNMYNTNLSSDATRFMAAIYSNINFSECKPDFSSCKNLSTCVNAANNCINNKINKIYENESIIPYYIRNADIIGIRNIPNYFDVINNNKTAEDNYFAQFPSSRYECRNGNCKYNYKDNSLGHLKYYLVSSKENNKTVQKVLSYVYGDYLTGGANWPRAVAKSGEGYDHDYDKIKNMYYTYVEGTCDDSLNTYDLINSGLSSDNVVTTMYVQSDGAPKRRCYEDGTWGPVENRCILFRLCRSFGLTVENMADIIYAYDKDNYLNRNKLRSDYSLKENEYSDNFKVWFANYIKSSYISNTVSNPIASFAVEVRNLNDVLQQGKTSVESIIKNDAYSKNINYVKGLTCNFSTSQEDSNNNVDSEISWSIENDLADVIQPLKCWRKDLKGKKGIYRLENIENFFEGNDSIVYYNKDSKLNKVYDILYNIGNIKEDTVRGLSDRISELLNNKRITFNSKTKRYYFNGKNNNSGIEFEAYKDITIGKGTTSGGLLSSYNSFQEVARCNNGLFYNGKANSEDAAKYYNIVYGCDSISNNVDSASFTSLSSKIKDESNKEYHNYESNYGEYIIDSDDCVPRFCGGNAHYGWEKSYVNKIAKNPGYYDLGTSYSDVYSALSCEDGYAFVLDKGYSENIESVAMFYGENSLNVNDTVKSNAKKKGWLDTLSVQCSSNDNYDTVNGAKKGDSKNYDKYNEADYKYYQYGNLGVPYKEGDSERYGFSEKLHKIKFCIDINQNICKEFDINDILNYGTPEKPNGGSVAFKKDYCVYMGCVISSNSSDSFKKNKISDDNYEKIEHSRGFDTYEDKIYVPFEEKVRIRNHEYDLPNNEYARNIVWNLCGAEEKKNSNNEVFKYCGTEDKVVFQYDQYVGPNIPDSFETWCNKNENNNCKKAQNYFSVSSEKDDDIYTTRENAIEACNKTYDSCESDCKNKVQDTNSEYYYYKGPNGYSDCKTKYIDNIRKKRNCENVATDACLSNNNCQTNKNTCTKAANDVFNNAVNCGGYSININYFGNTTYYMETFDGDWSEFNGISSSNPDENYFNKIVYEKVRDGSDDFKYAIGTHEVIKQAVLSNMELTELTMDLLTKASDDDVQKNLSGSINLNILKKYSNEFYKNKKDNEYYLFISSLSDNNSKFVSKYVDDSDNECSTNMCNSDSANGSCYVYTTKKYSELESKCKGKAGTDFNTCVASNAGIAGCMNNKCSSEQDDKSLCVYNNCIDSSEYLKKCTKKTFESKKFVSLKTFLNKYQSIYGEVIKSFDGNEGYYGSDGRYKYNNKAILTFKNIKGYYNSLTVNNTYTLSNNKDGNVNVYTVNYSLANNSSKYNYDTDKSSYNKYFKMQNSLEGGYMNKYIDLINKYSNIVTDYKDLLNKDLSLPYSIEMSVNGEKTTKELYFYIQNNTFSMCSEYGSNENNEICLNVGTDKSNSNYDTKGGDDYNIINIYNVSYKGVNKPNDNDIKDIANSLLSVYNRIYLGFGDDYKSINEVIGKVKNKITEIEKSVTSENNYKSYFCDEIKEFSGVQGFYADYECSLEAGGIKQLTSYSCKQRCSNAKFNESGECYYKNGSDEKFRLDPTGGGNYHVGIRYNDNYLRYGEDGPSITINSQPTGSSQKRRRTIYGSCDSTGSYSYKTTSKEKDGDDDVWCYDRNIEYSGDGQGTFTCIGFEEFVPNGSKGYMMAHLDEEGNYHGCEEVIDDDKIGSGDIEKYKCGYGKWSTVAGVLKQYKEGDYKDNKNVKMNENTQYIECRDGASCSAEYDFLCFHYWTKGIYLNAKRQIENNKILECKKYLESSEFNGSGSDECSYFGFDSNQRIEFKIEDNTSTCNFSNIGNGPSNISLYLLWLLTVNAGGNDENSCISAARNYLVSYINNRYLQYYNQTKYPYFGGYISIRVNGI